MTMPERNARWSVRVFAVFAAPVLLSCGSTSVDPRNSGASSSAAAPPAGAAGTCPDAAFISNTIGFPVRVFGGGTFSAGGVTSCAYQSTETQLGAFVSISVGPASEKDEAFEEVKSSARTFLGKSATAESIRVGEEGYAYGSRSKSEAVALSRGRVYRVDVTSTASADLGDKKAAVIQILERAMQ